VSLLELDGEEQASAEITLEDDGRSHSVLVRMGEKSSVREEERVQNLP
jgi:hypothetical protein